MLADSLIVDESVAVIEVVYDSEADASCEKDNVGLRETDQLRVIDGSLDMESVDVAVMREADSFCVTDSDAVTSRVRVGVRDFVADVVISSDWESVVLELCVPEIVIVVDPDEDLVAVMSSVADSDSESDIVMDAERVMVSSLVLEAVKSSVTD
jgi:hypothetical protein